MAYMGFKEGERMIGFYYCPSCKYHFNGGYCNINTDCNICKMQNENGNCKCLEQYGDNCPYYEEV